MAVILAFLYLGQEMYQIEYLLDGEKISFLKNFAVDILGVSNPSAIAGFFVFIGLAYLLVIVPLKGLSKKEAK